MHFFFLTGAAIAGIYGVQYDIQYHEQCEDQIRVTVMSVTLDIYHFFVLGTFKILSISYLEILS